MKFTLSLFLSFTTLALLAQTDRELLVQVQEQAQAMSDAFHKADYDTFMDSTHPRVIEMMDGRENMKALLSGGLGPGITFVKTDIVKAKKLFKKGDTYQCAMKQEQVMQVESKRYLIRGWLIGISYNAGSQWHFISVSNQTLKTLQEVFPKLSNKLPVKPQKEPKPIYN